MPDYIRLPEPPQLCMRYPTCSACAVVLETDGDGWTCPICGTQWEMSAGDGDTGELYPDWAGEEADGPEVKTEDAWRWGAYQERLALHQHHPGLFSKPEPPRG